MPKLKGAIQFTGKIGELSTYTMQGQDGIMMRQKGGASKEKIKNHPNFALTRLNNAEFGASSKAGKAVREAIVMVKHLANYNFSGDINAIAKTIIKQDKVNKWGERDILFSQYRHLLEGFSLNRQLFFNTVVRHPVICKLDRNTGSASLQLPNLLPGINFFTPPGQHLYQFIFTMGVIPDKVFTPAGYRPKDPVMYHPTTFTSQWHSVAEPMPAQSIELQLENFKGLTGSNSLVLAAGIGFGFPLSNNIVQPVKYAGTATILATA
jgi:hypothetical protein